MIDKVFGELEYEYGWNGNLKLMVFGKDYDMTLIIQAEEDEEISDIQYESYNRFVEKWEDIKQIIPKKLQEYYNRQRYELGYDTIDNPLFPKLESIKELSNMISLTGLIVPYSDTCNMFGGRCIMLIFDCKWDNENGIGMRFVDEGIDEIGYQDIAF